MSNDEFEEFDDFDDDPLSEMEGEDYDPMDEAPTGGRDPISSIGRGAVNDVVSMSTGTTIGKAILNNSLPSEYSGAVNAVDSGLSVASKAVDKVSKELKPATDALKSTVRASSTVLDKVLPTWAGDKVKNWAGDGGRDREYVDPDEAAIQSSSDIFNAASVSKDKVDDAKEEIKDKKEDLERAKGKVRNLENKGLLSSIAKSVGKLAGYQDTILINYQRKSLELQHRHYFVARDLLQVAKANADLGKEQLSVIMQNTALPEANKIKLTESYKTGIRDKFVGKGTAMFDGLLNGKFLTDKLGDYGETLKGAFEQGTDTLDMVRDNAEQAEEMGIDKGEMAGGLLGAILTGLGAKKVAGYVGGKINGNEKIKYGANVLGYGKREFKNILKDFGQSDGKGTSKVLNETLRKIGIGKRYNVVNSTGDELINSEDYKKGNLEDKDGNPIKKFKDITGAVYQVQADGTKKQLFTDEVFTNGVKEQEIEYDDSDDNIFIKTIKEAINDAVGGEGGLSLNGGLQSNASELIDGIDNLMRTTVVEIIPGYLSRILQQVTITATGDANTERMVYSSDLDDFATTSTVDNIVKDRFFKQKDIDDRRIQARKLADNILDDKDISEDGRVQLTEKLISDVDKFGNNSRFSLESLQNSEDLSPEITAALGSLYNGKDLDNIEALNRFSKEFRNIKDLDDHVEGLVDTYSSTGERDSLRRLGILDNGEDGLSRLNINNDYISDTLNGFSPEELEDNATLGATTSTTNTVPNSSVNNNRGYGDIVNALKTTFTDDSTEGVLWRVKLLGSGASSPIDPDDGKPFVGPSPMSDGPTTDSITTLNTTIEETQATTHALLMDVVTSIVTLSDASKSNVITAGGLIGAGATLAKNVGKITYDGLAGYYNKMWSVAGTILTGAGKVAKGVGAVGGSAMDKIRGTRPADVFVKGNPIPALRATLMERGEYFDGNTGEPITKPNDIKGSVKDKDGNLLISDEEYIEPGLTTANGTLLKNTFAGIRKVGGAALGVLGSAYGIQIGIAKWALDKVGGAYTAVANKIKLVRDVYVKGEPGVRLVARILKNGGYFNTDGTVIYSVDDIKGPIKDIEGNTLLTSEDLQKGLVDILGVSIDSKSLAGYLLRLTGKGIGMGFKAAKWTVKKQIEWAKYAGGKAVDTVKGTAKFIGGGIKGMTGVGGVSVGAIQAISELDSEKINKPVTSRLDKQIELLASINDFVSNGVSITNPDIASNDSNVIQFPGERRRNSEYAAAFTGPMQKDENLLDMAKVIYNDSIDKVSKLEMPDAVKTQVDSITESKTIKAAADKIKELTPDKNTGELIDDAAKAISDAGEEVSKFANKLTDTSDVADTGNSVDNFLNKAAKIKDNLITSGKDIANSKVVTDTIQKGKDAKDELTSSDAYATVKGTSAIAAATAAAKAGMDYINGPTSTRADSAFNGPILPNGPQLPTSNPSDYLNKAKGLGANVLDAGKSAVSYVDSLGSYRADKLEDISMPDNLLEYKSNDNNLLRNTPRNSLLSNIDTDITNMTEALGNKFTEGLDSVAALGKDTVKAVKDLAADSKTATDKDGDGDRDGSWQDQLSKKIPTTSSEKAAASKVLEQETKDTKQKYGWLQDMLTSGMGGIVEGIGGIGESVAGGLATLLGAKSLKDVLSGGGGDNYGEADDEYYADVDDLANEDDEECPRGKRGKKCRKRNKKRQRARNRIRRNGGNRAPRPKGFLGKAANVAKTVGRGVLNYGGKAATVLGGLELAGVSMGSIAAGVGGGVASAASGVGAALAGIGASIGAAGLLTIGAGVIVAGAAVYGAYKAFRYFSNHSDLEPLETLRYLDYGINPSDGDLVALVRELEHDVLGDIEWDGPSAYLEKKAGEYLEDYADDFKVNTTNNDEALNWLAWFQYRFAPVILLHLSVLKRLDKGQWGSVDLDDVDDEINDGTRREYVLATRFGPDLQAKGNDPYRITSSPIPNGGELTTRQNSDDYVKKLLAAIETGTIDEISIDDVSPSLKPKENKNRRVNPRMRKTKEEKEAAKLAEVELEKKMTKEELAAKKQMAEAQSEMAKAQKRHRGRGGRGKSNDDLILAKKHMEDAKLAQEQATSGADNASVSADMGPGGYTGEVVGMKDLGMGKLGMPVVGRISSPFGSRIHPITKKRTGHGGIDIAAPNGTPIYAAAAGKVGRKYVSKSYGNVIYLYHPDKTQTRYAHMSRFANLKIGDEVKKGQLLGYVGSTGHSTGNHLHFELRKTWAQGATPINPVGFFETKEQKEIRESIAKKEKEQKELNKLAKGPEKDPKLDGAEGLNTIGVVADKKKEVAVDNNATKSPVGAPAVNKEVAVDAPAPTPTSTSKRIGRKKKSKLPKPTSTAIVATTTPEADDSVSKPKRIGRRKRGKTSVVASPAVVAKAVIKSNTPVVTAAVPAPPTTIKVTENKETGKVIDKLSKQQGNEAKEAMQQRKELIAAQKENNEVINKLANRLDTLPVPGSAWSQADIAKAVQEENNKYKKTVASNKPKDYGATKSTTIVSFNS